MTTNPQTTIIQTQLDIYLSQTMSDHEKLVAIDMLDNGYDYKDRADIIEYWNERLS